LYADSGAKKDHQRSQEELNGRGEIACRCRGRVSAQPKTALTYIRLKCGRRYRRWFRGDAPGVIDASRISREGEVSEQLELEKEIAGPSAVTDAQRDALRALGAVEHAESMPK
jgi:hypothetical protein